MCVPLVLAGIGAAASVGSAVYGAVSQHEAGEKQKAIDYKNAQLADTMSKDALARGEVGADTARLQGRQVVAAQEVGYAGNGVDLSSQTVKDVTSSTAGMAEHDAQTIRNNAAREAWGYKTQGINFRQAGNLAETAGNNAAVGTLIGGAGQAIGYGARAYGDYRQSNPSNGYTPFASRPGPFPTFQMQNPWG